MRKLLLAAATAAALAGTAGIGHNMPPASVQSSLSAPKPQGLLPRRIVDEQRRNQKLRQKLRRIKRIQRLTLFTRAQRKTQKFGAGYRPGKLFKGHRV